MTELGRDPEAAHGLAVMADETHRLERLVGDLLDLARLEAGGDSLQREDVAVENLFGRVAARHEPEAKLRGIALVTSIAAGAEILYGDALRLEQALQNLAANALRHASPGGDVELRAELNGNEVLLSIRDTGTGIPRSTCRSCSTGSTSHRLHDSSAGERRNVSATAPQALPVRDR